MKKNTIKLVVIAVAASALVASVFGFLTTGFRSSDLTISLEGAPAVDMDDVVSFEGWRLRYDWEGATLVDGKMQYKGYDAVGALFDVNHEAVEAYEEQGYKVEYGAIIGVGSEDGSFYNTSSTLAVKKDGSTFVSKNGDATVLLAYSSDENAKLDDCTIVTENGLVRISAYVEFGGTIYIEGDQSLDNKTYVAASFLRLTDSMGRVQTKYTPAREVLSIVPLVLGDYE